jgi:hypothetical protein
MTLTSPPILLWTYLNAPVLVAGDYCDSWSVAVSDGPLTLITPRRWLDIRGYRLDGAWKTAQQAVVGVVFLHPGISQVSPCCHALFLPSNSWSRLSCDGVCERCTIDRRSSTFSRRYMRIVSWSAERTQAWTPFKVCLDGSRRSTMTRRFSGSSQKITIGIRFDGFCFRHSSPC